MNLLQLSPWFLLAQLLGIVTIIFEFVSYQIENKTKYFLVTGIGSFFWMTMFVSIGIATGLNTQISLIVAASYSTFRNLIFWRIFKKDTPKSKEVGLIFLLCMIVVALIAGVLGILQAPPEVRWVHILGMIGALSFVIGQYLPGVHAVRITVVFYSAAVLLTQTPLNILEGDFRWNPMGIAIESAKIISVLVFYARYRHQEKKPQLQFAKP